MATAQTNVNNGGVPRNPPRNAKAATPDIIEVFFTLLSKWKIILSIAIVGAIFGGVFNYFFIDTTYRADAQIYITNTNTTVNLQDIQLSSALTVDYKEIISSRSVMKKVIKELDLDINYEQLSKLITVENPTDSHIIRIYVQTPDPDLSLKIANTLVRIGIDKIYRVVGNDVPTIIDSAEVDAVKPIKPSILKYIFYGGFSGAVLVCGFFFLGMMLDNTIKTEDDVTNTLGLPVLACVPEFNEDSKKSTDDKSHHDNKKRRS